MPILTRYVLTELLKVFAVALGCLTALMLVVGILREALDEGLGFTQVLQLIPYILPDSLRFTMPATVLFAASTVFGRMSGSNEIVALKAMGISPMVVLWPVLVLSFFLSLLTVWLNDIAVSWGRNGVTRVVISAVEEIAYSRLQLHKSYSTPNFSINVKKVEGRKLIQPTFTFRSGKDKPTVTVRAEFATLSSNDRVLSVKCFNGVVDVEGGVSYRFPDYEIRELELADVSRRKDATAVSPSARALRDIRHLIGEREKEIAANQQDMAVKAAFQIMGGDFSALAAPEWKTEQQTHTVLLRDYYRLCTEPPRRWSNGFSCLCFTLVGSVVAIRRRNASMLSSFFVCFLPILIVYYPFLAFGVDRAKEGALPPAFVWMGNLVLLVWGLWELRKVRRY